MNLSSFSSFRALPSLVIALPFSFELFAAESSPPQTAPDSGEVCIGFGPQTPRDIDSSLGTNSRVFSLAPDYDEMNLCNIHFHNNAEHKAEAFSIFGGEGDYAGYQCGISKSLSDAELAAPASGAVCNGMMPGDTIEVHWVHSSCDVEPAPAWAPVCLTAVPTLTCALRPKYSRWSTTVLL